MKQVSNKGKTLASKPKKKRTVPKTKKTTRRAVRAHPKFGTSKLEEDFAKDFLERFALLPGQFCCQKIGKAACADAEESFFNPFFAQHFAHNRVIAKRIVDGLNAAGGLKAHLRTRQFVIVANSLAHHECGFGRCCRLNLSSRSFDEVSPCKH